MPSNVATSGVESRVEALGDFRVSVSIGVGLLPLVGTVLVMMGLFFTVGPSPIPNTGSLVYDLANVTVVVGLYRWLTADARRSVFRYERPSLKELGGAVVLAVVSISLIPLVVARTMSLVGLSGSSSVATLQSPIGAVILGVGAILIAPVAEEVIFRGFLFGTLLARYDPWVAILGSSAVFGVIHLFLGGVPNVLESFLVGVGFAIVRYRYDNLAGVGVAHALINAYTVAVGIGLIPALVAR